jgi:hypothetical protein
MTSKKSPVKDDALSYQPPRGVKPYARNLPAFQAAMRAAYQASNMDTVFAAVHTAYLAGLEPGNSHDDVINDIVEAVTEQPPLVRDMVENVVDRAVAQFEEAETEQ